MGILDLSILARPRRGLDRDVHRSWLDSLRTGGITAGSLLAWENAADGQFCIAAAGVLSISSGDHKRPTWQHIGWHQIERGGFDADTSTLRWTCYPADTGSRPADLIDTDRLSGSVTLQQPGRLPVIFRDRVNATIVVEQFVGLHDEQPAPGRQHRPPGVIISGRRDLGSRNSPIQWRASVPRGLSWDNPGLRELAAESTARIRAEYDPNG